MCWEKISPRARALRMTPVVLPSSYSPRAPIVFAFPSCSPPRARAPATHLVLVLSLCSCSPCVHVTLVLPSRSCSPRALLALPSCSPRVRAPFVLRAPIAHLVLPSWLLVLLLCASLVFTFLSC